jgi:hypothetical protein
LFEAGWWHACLRKAGAGMIVHFNHPVAMIICMVFKTFTVMATPLLKKGVEYSTTKLKKGKFSFFF